MVTSAERSTGAVIIAELKSQPGVRAGFGELVAAFDFADFGVGKAFSLSTIDEPISLAKKKDKRGFYEAIGLDYKAQS